MMLCKQLDVCTNIFLAMAKLHIIKGREFHADSFLSRMFRVLRFDARVYEEAMSVKNGSRQAFLIVFLSSLAGGAGTLFPNPSWQAFFLGTFASFAGWLTWALVMYWVGAKIVAGPLAYLNQNGLLIAASFASAPGVIRILGMYTPVRPAVFLIALVWTFIVMVIAVRRAMNYSTLGDAMFVCLAGCFAHIVLMYIIYLSNKFI